MSCSTAATPPNKLELTLDEHAIADTKGRTPCETPKGYRAIPLDITPTTWKADLSKCNVCEARFTWLNHRHKCRKCMEAVCHTCSKDRKVLRAHTPPKRVCDRCIKSCWTPRGAPATPRKSTAAGTAAAEQDGKDGRRVSLTVSASDANACPVVATATAPLSPGTPAAAGFFGPGCVTPSAATAAPAPPPVEGAVVDVNTTTSNVDTRPPMSSSSARRRHRRQASVAMPSLPLASPAASVSTSPSSTMMMMLPPPTPAAAAALGEEEEEGKEEANGDMPPSAAGSPTSSASPPSASPAPFFGGRHRQGGARRSRSRRESSGGRLESRVWGGVRALGGGGDVDKAVAELQQLHEAQSVEAEAEGEGQIAEEAAASSAPAAAVLPVLPEEPAVAVPASADDDAAKAAGHEGEGDCEEGGPMMMKITAWSGAAMGGLAVGTGVVVAVVLRSAFAVVFLY